MLLKKKIEKKERKMRDEKRKRRNEQMYFPKGSA